ncbi:tetratricopeptide repeat protein [Planctomycetota bacterium]
MNDFDLLFFPFSVVLSEEGETRSSEQSVLSRCIPLLLCEQINKLGNIHCVFSQMVTQNADSRTWLLSSGLWTKKQALEVVKEQSLNSEFLVIGQIDISEEVHIVLQIHSMEGEIPLILANRRFPKSSLLKELNTLLADVIECVGMELTDKQRQNLLLTSTDSVDAFIHYAFGRDSLEAHQFDLEIENKEKIFDSFIEALKEDRNYVDSLTGIKVLAADYITRDTGPNDIAREALLKTLEYSEKDHELLALLAASHESDGHHQEASSYWERCAVISDHAAEAWFRAGVCHEESGDLIKALEMLDKCLEDDPRFLDAHEHKGLCLANLARLEDAIESWRQVLILDADQSSAFGNLGKALHMLGQLDRAEEYFKLGLTATRPYWNIFHNYSVLLKEGERWLELIDLANHYLEVHPHDPHAYYFRACGLHHLKRNKEATSDLMWVLAQVQQGELKQQAVKLLGKTNKSPLEFHLRMGIYHSLTGDATAGIRHLNLILKAVPDAWNAWYHLGVAHKRLEKPEKAVEFFELVLKSYNEYAPTRNELGCILIDEGNFIEAKTHLQHACELDPANARYFCNLSLVYMNLGDINTAGDILRHARKLAPEDPVVMAVHRILHGAQSA